MIKNIQHKFYNATFLNLILLYLVFASIFGIAFFQHPSNNSGEIDIFCKDSDKLHTSSPPIPIIQYDWMETWDHGGEEKGIALSVDSNDNIIVAGDYQLLKGSTVQKSNCFVLKYNSLGTLIWNTTWGLWNGTWGSPDCEDIVIDSNNNIYLTGEVYSSSNKGELFIRKYDTDGDLQWHTEWGDEDFDSGYFITLDSSENLIIGGTTENPSTGDNEIAIARFNSLTGNQNWITTWSLPENNYIKGLVVDSNDDIYVNLYNSGSSNHYLTKFNTTGYELWNISLGGDIMSGMDIHSDDNITLTIKNGDYQYLRKFDTAGTEIWSRDWFIGDAWFYYCLVIDSNDSIYLGCSSESIIKYSENGDYLWELTHTGEFISECTTDIGFDSENNIYYTGYCYSGETIYMRNAEDVLIVKYGNKQPNLYSSKFEEKNIYALVMGIGNYPGTVNDLLFTFNDAEAIYFYLTKTCNILPENIIKLHDIEATESGINNALATIQSQITENDDLFIYYSGHGSDGAFCPHDTLNYPYSDLDAVLDGMNCASKTILIDACESGSAVENMTDPDLYILTSCESGEVSIETFQLIGGVFTEFFIDAHPFVNDTDADNAISFEEQYPYIYTEVSSYAAQYGVSQHPVQFDNNSGPTVHYPCIRDINFKRNNQKIEYSFEITGSGQIYGSILEVTANNQTLILDVANSSLSQHGFGEYSGVINVQSTQQTINCELIFYIDGNRLRTISAAFDLSLSSSSSSPPSIPFSDLYLVFMFCGVSICILKNKTVLQHPENN